MGLFSKFMLFVLLLVSVYFSAWILAIPLVLYFLFALFHRKKAKEAIIIEKERGRGLFGRFEKRYIIGALFLTLSLIAFLEEGKFSVAVFLTVGLVIIFSAVIANSPLFSMVEPVSDSILLKQPAIPFKWISLVEVKTTVKQLSPILASVHEKVLVWARGNARVFMSLEAFSTSRVGAEAALAKRMRRVARSLAPLGGYLLPLDADQAAKTFSVSIQPEDIEQDDWPTSFDATQFDLVILQPKGGFLKSVGAYSVEDEEVKRASIPPPRQRLKIQPLFWETLEALDKRIRLPESDSMTAFLANLCSARNMTLGQALSTTERNDAGTLSVSCLTSPPVEISRSQLRALLKVYSNEIGKTTS